MSPTTTLTTTALSLTLILTASAAFAQEAPTPAAAPTPAPTPAPEAQAKLIDSGHVFALGFASQWPAALVAFSTPYDLAIGVGGSFGYNGDNQPGTTDKVKAGVNAWVHYFVINKAPFAMGPEILYSGALTPGDAFNTNTVQPGWAFWYGPWQAPILIGAGWGAAIGFGKGIPTTVDLNTAALRFAWVLK